MSPRPGVQRRHQAHRGQRVVGTAPVRQCSRLRHQRGVPVLLEQLRLELRHDVGPGAVARRRLLRHLGVVLVVVVHVVRGQRVLQAEHVDGHAALELELRAEALEEIVEAIGPARAVSPRVASPADAGRADPRQVVEPDVLDRHLVGIDAEIVAEPSLGPDGDVAQAHGPVALVEQRLGHDPHRVGEVHQPRAGVGPGRHLLRQPQHDRHRAQRLGQPAGADRLLAQAPVPDGQGLVDVAGRLAADAQLDDDEVGALRARRGGRPSSRRSRPIPAPAGCARRAHRRPRAARRSGRAGRGRRRPSGPPGRTARRPVRGCRCSLRRRRPPWSPRSAT